jgi:Leucine-rich repeat (LRR) protein
VIFYNSQLEKLSVNDFNLLAHIESLTAANVGLKELYRDDFKPYNKLLKLDISQNNLTYLGNMVFRYLESLEFLNLSKNKIKSIHIGSFDECSQTLKIIDLSYNNLIAFPANILDALSVAKLELHLQYNEIELMAVPIVNKDISLHTLDISNNKIKNFRFNCTEIETLWLNDNQLKEFLTPNCSIQNLHLSNNQLEELKIEKVSSLFLSQNFRLKKLLINDVSEIVSLEASDFNSNVITMAMLKNATQLINLDLSGTYIGPLAFDTFADMTELEELRLKNTGKNF